MALAGRAAAMGQPSAGHAFADASFFRATDLPVEEVVGLLDEADGDVGESFTHSSPDECALRVDLRPIGRGHFQWPRLSEQKRGLIFWASIPG